jgi:hypothetical protein
MAYFDTQKKSFMIRILVICHMDTLEGKKFLSFWIPYSGEKTPPMIRKCSVYFCIAILNSTGKKLCLPYDAYVFSSTKLVIRAEQVLPGSEWGRREEGGGGRQEGEMTQKMYAHVNK